MKEYQFDLVKSTYPAHDAKEVLLSLINDKIKFLNCKAFSLSERFGSVPSHLEKRISELKEEKQLLVETLGQCDEDHLVKIDCQVVFNITEGATDEDRYQEVLLDQVPTS